MRNFPFCFCLFYSVFKGVYRIRGFPDFVCNWRGRLLFELWSLHCLLCRPGSPLQDSLVRSTGCFHFCFPKRKKVKLLSLDSGKFFGPPLLACMTWRPPKYAHFILSLDKDWRLINLGYLFPLSLFRKLLLRHWPSTQWPYSSLTEIWNFVSKKYQKIIIKI